MRGGQGRTGSLGCGRREQGTKSKAPLVCKKAQVDSASLGRTGLLFFFSLVSTSLLHSKEILVQCEISFEIPKWLLESERRGDCTEPQLEHMMVFAMRTLEWQKGELPENQPVPPFYTDQSPAEFISGLILGSATLGSFFFNLSSTYFPCFSSLSLPLCPLFSSPLCSCLLVCSAYNRASLSSSG